MASTATATLGTSNLRASARQTRMNPTRTSKTFSTSFRQNSLISNPTALPPNANEPHGFYPAVTHFTDAITALPREYRRHTSLLREVDAKSWAPEERLQTLLSQCLAAAPLRSAAVVTQPSAAQDPATESLPSQTSAANSVSGAPIDDISVHSSQSGDPAASDRRALFSSLRSTLIELIGTKDEEIHVMNNANEELSRHLRRLDNVFPYIAEEISEEARLGSTKHWAYFETSTIRKPIATSSRREAAAASLASMHHDTEAAHRSAQRRGALQAKNQRLNNVESDFDDGRPIHKRANINGKARRIGEITAESTGLGISGAGPGKKRKVEKPAIGGAAMERALSGAGMGGRAMSREPSQQDGGLKKRKAPTSAGTVARKRFIPIDGAVVKTADPPLSRINANPQDSPKLASSPLATSFAKDTYKRSPIPSAARPVSSRARQNSNQPPEGSRGRPSSSTSHKISSAANGVSAITSEIPSVATMTNKTATEVKQTIKESSNGRGDRLLEDDISTSNGMNNESGLSRGGIALERGSSRQGSNLKREMIESNHKSGASPRLPPSSLQLSDSRFDRPGRGRGSKTSTPVIGTFAESSADGFEDPNNFVASSSANGNHPANGGPTLMKINTNSKRPARPRTKDYGLQDSLSPKGLPPKRSHKKGAGLLATQQAAAAAAAAAKSENPGSMMSPVRAVRAGSDVDPESRSHSRNHALNNETDGNMEMSDAAASDEEVEMEGDEEEERYCYCNNVSYGEMVACDNKSCPREWFHLECVGLATAPGRNTKWYCDECTETMKRGRG